MENVTRSLEGAFAQDIVLKSQFINDLCNLRHLKMKYYSIAVCIIRSKGGFQGKELFLRPMRNTCRPSRHR